MAFEWLHKLTGIKYRIFVKFLCVKNARAPPAKLVVSAPKAPLGKHWGWSAKNGCHKVIQKEDPLETFGNQNWGGGGFKFKKIQGILLRKLWFITFTVSR